MSENKTISFHTLGCKLNYAETSTISRMMEKDGFSKINFEEGADIYVINTCSVTENADKECKKIIDKALRINSEARVVVIGCYAQLKPKEISEMKGVDMVLGAKEKFELAKYLKQLPEKKSSGIFHSCEIDETTNFNSSYSFGERTRAFLKVQDGCNYNCSYCTIPLARGASRSDKIEHVLQQANEISSLGVKEIVLTGVNIGDFGIEKAGSINHEETFFDLVKALDEVEDIKRFRISSIEPNLLTDEIIDFVSASKKFVPHFHIPLQSGSNKILKLMRRRYLRELYVERVNKIKEVMPHCCIGVDVIVGFPNETNEDFLDTYNFLNELDISYLHVFTYSERDNTEAKNISEVIPLSVRRERNKMLRILSEKKRRNFYENNIGETRPVLFEMQNNSGILEGFTDNYIKVQIPFDEKLTKQLVNFQLENLNGEFVVGNLVSENSFA